MSPSKVMRALYIVVGVLAGAAGILTSVKGGGWARALFLVAMALYFLVRGLRRTA